MILNVHVPGAHAYDIGEEIWQQPLHDAIREEAETIADYAGSDLLESPDREHRDQLCEQIITAMTSALVHVGDRYRAPDGVLYTLLDDSAGEDDEPVTIADVSSDTSPTVQEVLRFETPPIGSLASRRAIVRWSDGTEGEALSWYDDEILSPVDHVGRPVRGLNAGNAAS
jgi:hypothetical protein